MVGKPFPLDKRYIVFKNGKVKGIKVPFLKPALHKKGYLQLAIGGKTYKLHRVVAYTHVKNPKNYYDVNHLDGNKLNCHYKNLEWCNDSINIKHAFTTGLRTHRGESNVRALLTENDIIDIKKKIADKISNVKIASEYGVNHRTISAIKTGKNWNYGR